MKKLSKFVALLFLLASPSLAQKNLRIDDSQIGTIIKELKDKLNIPGIAVGIAIDNKIEYGSVFGYANLETKKDLRINSIWNICSISKQFAVVSCLKLAEENKLSLHDKISKYIENLPQEYSDITIIQLLSHTSGIKDYINEKKLYGLPWERVKGQVFKDTLNFNPGDAWRYSNTGFWIVAQIIEKVTGMDYNQYLAQNFFTKLKMDQTKRVSDKEISDLRVNGYIYENGQYGHPSEDINKFCGQGVGDLMSTVNDLLKWNIALTRGKIIKKKSFAMLWTPTKLNNGIAAEVSPGSGMNYGLGWFIKNLEGDKIVWTPGSGFGFSTSSQYVPKYDLTVIVFCNKQEFLMADQIGFSVVKGITGGALRTGNWRDAFAKNNFMVRGR